MPDDRRFEDEDTVDWAVRTGRFAAERASFWRQQLAAEQRQAKASGGRRPQNAVSEVEATIRSLAPVLAEDPAERPRVPGSPWLVDGEGRAVWAGAYAPAAGHSTSDTPLLDEEDRKLFGPTPEQRRREQDVSAEAELRAQLAEEERQRAVEAALSDDAFDALFPDHKKR